LVAKLTVLENIAVGSHQLHARRADALAHARTVAQQVGIPESMLEQPAAELTVAGRKRLELARALATEPKLLLLDEVMAGLNPQEITEIIGIIRKIREAGVTILLIEHVMHAVMSLSEHIYVLSYGKIIAQGAPLEIVNNRDVVEAYLGRGAAEQMAMASAENPHA
jgi:branched-chain amino acid transport system ATP-binding protein